MPYRDARTPLLQRRSTLTRDLAALDVEIERTARLSGERGGILAELDSLEERLVELRPRTLPLLTSIAIATPCTASWDHMPGDDRVRSCGECELDVVDISRMTEDEAEAFLQERVGTRTCVRLHRRVDGTIITSDCSVAVHRKRMRWRIAGSLAAILAAGMALTATKSPPAQPLAPRRAAAPVSPAALLEQLGTMEMGGLRMVSRPAPKPRDMLGLALPECGGASLLRECDQPTVREPRAPSPPRRKPPSAPRR